ncbi:MAG: EAL domain-containing protein [Gammaproteobacteria bacterium]
MDDPVIFSLTTFSFLLICLFFYYFVRLYSKLKESESNFRLLFEKLPDPAWIIIEHHFVDANDAALKTLGYTEKPKFLSLHPSQVSPEFQPDGESSFSKAERQIKIATENGIHRFEWVHSRLDGSLFPVEVTLTTFSLKGKKAIYCLWRDISERKKAETGLQLAAKVFTHAQEGITVTDVNSNIIEINDAFTRITGYRREEVLGKNPRILKSDRQTADFYNEMWESLLNKGHWSGEVWNRHKSGENYAAMLTISAVLNDSGVTQNYVGLLTDITAKKVHEEQLEYFANYDILTKLPNRALLADRLNQSMIRISRLKNLLAVLYIDLDGFKEVNDKYGHDVGDKLLIAIAGRLKEVLREGDTLARFGGDEFVGVLVDLEQLGDYRLILNRLLQAAAKPVRLDNFLLNVSASIGVTLYPKDDVDADQLIRHADQAMYQAKQTGKNRYFLFDVAHDTALQSVHEYLNRICQAFDRREFVLFYQPMVNMKTGQVIGAEALIRWNHPERGLLSPAEFLPHIESHPISVKIGEWVIDTVLSQISQWQAAGLNISISVNIAARQLQQVDFTTRLSQILATHPDVNPKQLELEILETSALEDIYKVSKVIQECGKIGVSFALDDFGTGYSSLTYLKQLPARLLKIDQSFVRNMLDNSDDLAIVEGVVGLAETFRRRVIAEGVETVSHGEILLTLGCELAQGYGIARPMPAAELQKWKESWRPAESWRAWKERPLNRDDIVVVFTEVEHRHWLRTIETFLNNEVDVPTILDAHDFRFSRWQNTEGRLRYENLSEFHEIVALHNHIHKKGGELIEMNGSGKKAELTMRKKELYSLCDELSKRLRYLIRNKKNENMFVP